MFSKNFYYAEEGIKRGRDELEDLVEIAKANKDAGSFDISKIPNYIPSMRREINPYFIKVKSNEDIESAKRLLVENACKEPSDFLAKYLHKPIENWIVLHISDFKTKPIRITVIVNILAFFIALLFFSGYLLLASSLTFLLV